MLFLITEIQWHFLKMKYEKKKKRRYTYRHADIHINMYKVVKANHKTMLPQKLI